MKRLNKKAFTIVELIVVIVIIGILAAILIPNVVKYIDNSKVVKDKELVSNLNKALVTDSLVNGKHTTSTAAFAAAEDFGYDVPKIVASKVGNDILWDSENDQFVYIDENGVNYVPEYTGTKITDKDSYKLFKVYSEVPTLAEQTNSIYYTGTAESVELNGVGFDAGESAVTSVIYNGTNTPNEVVIRTNSANTTLAINAEHDTVNHYGNVGKVDAQKIDMNCYNEYGTAAYVKVTEGKVVAKDGGSIAIVFAANNDKDAVAVIKETNGTIERGLTVIQPVSDTNEARTNGIPLEYSVDGETAATKTTEQLATELETREAAVEVIAQEAINTAIENTVFAGVAVTRSGEATQLMTLVKFANAVNAGNSYAGYTIKLLDDIDLGNTYWTPIGTKDHPFSGVFNGNNKTIKNINIDSTGNGNTFDAQGLFGATENATITNLTLENIDITSDFEDKGGVGALVGYALNGISLERITVDSNSSLTAKYAGGLIGYTNATKNSDNSKRDCQYIISNCEVLASVNGTRVGGFIGRMDGSDNTVYGFSNGYAIFNYCSFSGIVTANGDTPMAGGFVGQKTGGNNNQMTISFNNCSVVNKNANNDATIIGEHKGDFFGFSQNGFMLWGCKVNNISVISPEHFIGTANYGISVSINGVIYRIETSSGYPATPSNYDIKYTATYKVDGNWYSLSKTFENGSEEGKVNNIWYKVTNAYTDMLGNIIFQADSNTIFKGTHPEAQALTEGSKLQQRKYIAGWDATNNIHVYNFDMWRVVPSDTAETEGWMDTLVLSVGEYFQDPTDYVDTELYNITSYQSESNNTVYVVVAK